jgi:hypothetical protein
MTAMSRLLLRVARWIAGKERADWVDGMASEAALSGRKSTAWAAGCLWAAVQDRLRRDWWFPLAILVLPACALIWRAKVFFWTNPVLANHSVPTWIPVAIWILSPFPLVFLFAHWRSGRSALVALAISFVLVEIGPILLMWLILGVPPTSWVGPNVNWYKADPNIVIKAVPGIALDLAVWMMAAWLGSLSRKARPFVRT